MAIVTDTSSAHGTMLDHACDRVGDVAAGIVLCRAGAPRVLVIPAIALSLAQETWLRRVSRSSRSTSDQLGSCALPWAMSDGGSPAVAGRRSSPRSCGTGWQLSQRFGSLESSYGLRGERS